MGQSRPRVFRVQPFAHLWNDFFSETSKEVEDQIAEYENALEAKVMLEQVLDGIKAQYDNATAELAKRNDEVLTLKNVRLLRN